MLANMHHSVPILRNLFFLWHFGISNNPHNTSRLFYWAISLNYLNHTTSFADMLYFFKKHVAITINQDTFFDSLKQFLHVISLFTLFVFFYLQH